MKSTDDPLQFPPIKNGMMCGKGAGLFLRQQQQQKRTNGDDALTIDPYNT